MKDVITHVFTGKDNFTFDLIKVFGAFTMIIFFIGTIYNMLTAESFDSSAFCTNASILLVAIAGGVKVKETTEPS